MFLLSTVSVDGHTCNPNFQLSLPIQSLLIQRNDKFLWKIEKMKADEGEDDKDATTASSSSTSAGRKSSREHVPPEEPGYEVSEDYHIDSE